jgi:hypothetical protein
VAASGLGGQFRDNFGEFANVNEVKLVQAGGVEALYAMLREGTQEARVSADRALQWVVSYAVVCLVCSISIFYYSIILVCSMFCYILLYSAVYCYVLLVVWYILLVCYISLYSISILLYSLHSISICSIH